MRDLRRVSGLAVLLVILLRMAIGWQFLYEGMWKYDTMDTASPWSADGYLRNAQGPFRDYFRSMTGDPDELGWLDFDTVSGRWDAWKNRFTAHYQLDEAQQAQLGTLLDGAQTHVAPLAQLPASASFLADPKSSADRQLAAVVKYNPQSKTLTVSGDTPLLPSEVARLRGAVPVARDGDQYVRTDGQAGAPDPVDLAYLRAVERLEKLSSDLGYRQRLAASLKGDPDRVGVVGRLTDRGSYQPEMGTVTAEAQAEEAINIRYGEMQVYRDMLAKYEADLALAQTDFQRDHLDKVWQRIQQKRVELVGPAKGLDAELKDRARKLLTAEQLARGPVPPEPTPLYQADQQAMWGLIVLGILLIVGLFTPFAALGGAVMLTMFYLVVPPWPGVAQPPSPEHAFVVNKNLIEAVALLGIAALPTGRWFGLDALLLRPFRGSGR
jgi:uncharacterized membrane protein YphA (DoxX/SURF4 family)